MNISVSNLTVIIFVAGLAGCGGGTGSSNVTMVPDLASISETDELQALVLEGSNVQDEVTNLGNIVNLTDYESQLKYVAILENGNLIGIPMDNIPASMSFTSEGTGFMEVITTSSHYVLSSGDVSGTLSTSESNLDILISWQDDEIEYLGSNSDVDNSLVNMSIESNSMGVSACGLQNQFCGGTVSVSTNDVTIASEETVSSENLIVGVYGNNAADGEIGGRINHTNSSTFTAVGSFIAQTSQ